MWLHAPRKSWKIPPNELTLIYEWAHEWKYHFTIIAFFSIKRSDRQRFNRSCRPFVTFPPHSHRHQDLRPPSPLQSGVNMGKFASDATRTNNSWPQSCVATSDQRIPRLLFSRLSPAYLYHELWINIDNVDNRIAVIKSHAIFRSKVHHYHPKNQIAIMVGPGVGYEQPREKVTWLKRDILLFANSIGCTTDELHFLYVGINHQVTISNGIRR